MTRSVQDQDPRVLNLIPQGAKATGENERDNWQTPEYILKPVKAFYSQAEGYFDEGHFFDPFPPNWEFYCSVTPEYERTDGFTSAWDSEAFINPPFSRYKEAVEHGLLQPPEQIWISHTNNSTGWYKRLLSSCDALVLLKDRVKFIDPRTGKSAGTAIGKSQSLFYRGERVNEFKQHFSSLGKVVAL